ncbi:unnamed protein product [Dibothriocephalus latus]|uniref:Uncharacterized protein n=1 Tax=Dibothriocephalus latus TaxID=60516 RepID=A0A3P7N7A7_DIBLA|nr:unnamed protein product [Dibothriocephalus latus]
MGSITSEAPIHDSVVVSESALIPRKKALFQLYLQTGINPLKKESCQVALRRFGSFSGFRTCLPFSRLVQTLHVLLRHQLDLLLAIHHVSFFSPIPVNVTPSKSTDLTLKPPAQTPSPSSSQKKTEDLASIMVAGTDCTSPTPTLMNRMSVRMDTPSPQMSSSSRPSASTFLTGSPMIAPASVCAPGLNSPLFRGGVGSRAQKMLALGLKKAAELSKHRASQSSIDSQSSSCDEASLDRRSPLTSPPSVHADITEAGRPGNCCVHVELCYLI